MANLDALLLLNASNAERTPLGKTGKPLPPPLKGRHSILSYFSSSPAPAKSTPSSSSAAPSSPARAAMPRAASDAANGEASASASGAGDGATGGLRASKGTTGRALAGTKSALTLSISNGKDDDGRHSASSTPGPSLTVPSVNTPRRSPRAHSKTPSVHGIDGSGTPEERIKMEESPMRSKLRSSEIKPNITFDNDGNVVVGEPKLKGKGMAIELSDSDEEGTSAHVLAPSSVSPATVQRRREALAKRIRSGANGKEELDLTVSSPKRAPTDDDEIVYVSRPSSRPPKSKSPSVVPSRASSKTPRANGGAMLPPSQPSPSKGKAKEVREDRQGSPRLNRIRSVSSASSSHSSSTAPIVPSPLSKGAPTTPRKAPAAVVPKPPTPAPLTSATIAVLLSPARDVTRAHPSLEIATVASSTPRITTSAVKNPNVPSFTFTASTSSISSPPSNLLQAAARLAAAALPPFPRTIDAPPSSDLASLLPSNLPSLPTTPSKSRQLAFNAFLAANRTPGGGPTYLRDPSGSPLSSAGPTPKKQLSRSSTWPATASKRGSSSIAGKHTATKRRLEFEIIIDDGPSSAIRKESGKTFLVTKKRVNKPHSSIRQPRDGTTSEAGTRDDTEMQDVSEEGSGSESSDDDDEFESAKEGSPSPVKRRVSPAKAPEGKGKRTAHFGSDDEDDDSLSESDSKPSKASSPAPSSYNEPDADDSDTDDFAKMLADAAVRRASGKTLITATSPANASVGTAPTSVSPVKQPDPVDDGGIRRSSREKRATEHYSPTRTDASTSTAIARRTSGGGVAASKVKTDLLGLKTSYKGRLGFDSLVGAHQANEAKGREANWMQKAMAELENEKDDLDSHSEHSDSDDALVDPSTLSALRSDATTQIAKRAIASASDDDDDDLPAPGTVMGSAKKKQKKGAEAVTKLLDEEQARAVGLAQEGESKAQREERTVWEKGEVKIAAIETLAKGWVGEGWRGLMAKSLKDAIAHPSSFPSPLLLFSRLSSNGMGEIEDHLVVSRWLLTLICHPSTSTSLAARAEALLGHIAKHVAHSSSSAPSPLLTTADLLAPLIALGAKPGGATPPASKGKGKEKAADQDDLTDLTDLDSEDSFDAQDLLSYSKKIVEPKKRRACVRRWCRVVQLLANASPVLLSGDDVTGLVAICIRLSLDPTSALLRHPLSGAISALLASKPGGVPPHSLIFRLLARTHRKSRARLQYEVLQTLPRDSLASKSLRRWLATSFLSSDEQVADMRDTPNLSGSVLPVVVKFLASPPPNSAFKAAPDGDVAADTKLFNSMQILMTALTELGDEITTAQDKLERRVLLDRIVSSLRTLDSKMRADAKKGLAVERLAAKNLILNLCSSIRYQLKAVRPQTSFGFSQEEEAARDVRDRKAEETERKRLKEEAEREREVTEVGKDGTKQARLSFGAPVSAAAAVSKDVGAQTKENLPPVVEEDTTMQI